jgi:putative FmdB family regulatory protein
VPNYGYRCAECKHEFTVFQSMKDDPVKICPECSGEVRRLMYPVGVVFKGSGWYINDSRKPEPSESGEKPADKTETKADTAAATSGETKSETPKTEAAKPDAPKTDAATKS